MRAARGPRFRIGWLMAVVGAVGLVAGVVAAVARGEDVAGSVAAAYAVYVVVVLAWIARDAATSRPGGG